MRSDREFRYECSTLWRVFLPVMLACVILRLGVIAVRAFTPHWLPTTGLGSHFGAHYLINRTVSAAIGIALFVTMGYFYIAVLRRCARGSVSTSAVGLTVRGGNRVERHVSWDEIASISVTDRLVTGAPVDIHIKVAWRDGEALIYMGIPDRQELLDIITARAGLVVERRTWLRTRYTRPTQEQPHD